MGRWQSIRAGLAILTGCLAAGCFNPDIQGAGGYSCADRWDCPPGIECDKAKGKCHDRPAADLGQGKEAGGKDLALKKEQGAPRDKGFIYADGPANCGNGKIEHGEVCDGKNFGAATCANYDNNTGGELLCLQKCTMINSNYCYKLTAATKDTSALDGKSSAAPRAALISKENRVAVTWADPHSGTSYLNNTRVQVLDTGLRWMLNAPVNITNTASYYQQRPDVAALNRKMVLAWEDGRDKVTKLNKVRAARVSIKGVVEDKGGVQVDTVGTGAQGQPAIGCRDSSDSCLVVWADFSKSIKIPEIKGTIVTEKGSAFTPGKTFTISTATTYKHQAPSVASDGKDYMVVWRTTNAKSETLVYGRGVYGSGTLAGSWASQISSDSSKVSFRPDVAYIKSKNHYLVVWEDNRNATTDIYGARITPKVGLVHNYDKFGLKLAISSYTETSPRVACGDPACVVVYSEGSSRTVQSYIRGVRFEDKGGSYYSLWDKTGFKIANNYRAASPYALKLTDKTFALFWREQPAKGKPYALKAATFTP